MVIFIAVLDIEKRWKKPKTLFQYNEVPSSNWLACICYWLHFEGHRYAFNDQEIVLLV